MGYGWEIVSTDRLVMTPLTTRARRAILAALQFECGVAAIGSTGTGKTETIRDLSRVLGRLCTVFACGAGLDQIGVARCLAGVAGSGAWTCFEDFNIIAPEVLSATAGMFAAVLRGLAVGAENVVVGEYEVPLDPMAAVFMTLSTGYPGRRELPHNLRNLVRPVAMLVPDVELIARTLLITEGFKAATRLAVKLTHTLSLLRSQTSQAKHYDFGLRTLRSVLRAALIHRESGVCHHKG